MANASSVKALEKRGIEHDKAVILAEAGITVTTYKDHPAKEIQDLTGLNAAEVSEIVKSLSLHEKRARGSGRGSSAALANLVYEEVDKAVEKRSETFTRIDDELHKLADQAGFVLPQRVIRDLAEQIHKRGIAKKHYARVLELSYNDFQNSIVEPMEPCGVVAATSIGEPGTQLTMRTFHKAGSTDLVVTEGLPRLTEILDAKQSASTPTMILYLDPSLRTNRQAAEDICNYIENTPLEKIARIEMDEETLDAIVIVDKATADAKGIPPEEVLDRLRSISKYSTVSWPEAHDDAPAPLGADPHYVFVVSTKEGNYRQLEMALEELGKHPIRGIKDIEEAQLRNVKESDNVDLGDDEPYVGWRIITRGADLASIFQVKGIMHRHVRTNDVRQIYDTLGVEAARRALYEEASQTMRNAGLNVDLRHLMLVADAQTQKGQMRGVGRNGVTDDKRSVLARAAFETTVKHLFEAAVTGEADTLEGASENIIVGRPARLGTGLVELALNLRRREELRQTMPEPKSTVPEPEETDEEEDDDVLLRGRVDQ